MASCSRSGEKTSRPLQQYSETKKINKKEFQGCFVGCVFRTDIKKKNALVRYFFRIGLAKDRKTAEATPKKLRGVRSSHMYSQFYPSCPYSKTGNWHRKDTSRTSASGMVSFNLGLRFHVATGSLWAEASGDKWMMKLPVSFPFDQVM